MLVISEYEMPTLGCHWLCLFQFGSTDQHHQELDDILKALEERALATAELQLQATRGDGEVPAKTY